MKALRDKVEVLKGEENITRGETKYSPVHLITQLANALRIGTDELLGVKRYIPD